MRRLWKLLDDPRPRFVFSGFSFLVWTFEGLNENHWWFILAALSGIEVIRAWREMDATIK